MEKRAEFFRAYDESDMRGLERLYRVTAVAAAWFLAMMMLWPVIHPSSLWRGIASLAAVFASGAFSSVFLGYERRQKTR
jgi:hypothetical protein